ncbi:hypothetical protein Ancab_026359 [Ancistrocladus abbreviatus]
MCVKIPESPPSDKGLHPFVPDSFSPRPSFDQQFVDTYIKDLFMKCKALTPTPKRSSKEEKLSHTDQRHRFHVGPKAQPHSIMTHAILNSLAHAFYQQLNIIEIPNSN